MKTFSTVWAFCKKKHYLPPTRNKKEDEKKKTLPEPRESINYHLNYITVQYKVPINQKMVYPDNKYIHRLERLDMF